jgi:hypothetical protein
MACTPVGIMSMRSLEFHTTDCLAQPGELTHYVTHAQIMGPGFVVDCGMGLTLQALGTICLPVLVPHGCGPSAETYRMIIGPYGLLEACGSAGDRRWQGCSSPSRVTIEFVVVEGKVRPSINVRWEDAWSPAGIASSDLVTTLA